MSVDLRYREFAAPLALSAYVRCIWRMAGRAALVPPEPIIPDGCAEIVMNLADAFVRHTDAASDYQPLRLVAGQITRAITIQPSGRVSLWGIRFQPWGAAPFLDFSGREMRDRLTSLDEISRDLATDLETISDVYTDSEQLSAIVTALTRRVARARQLDQRLRRNSSIASTGSSTPSPYVARVRA